MKKIMPMKLKTALAALLVAGIAMFGLAISGCSNGFAETAKATAQKAPEKTLKEARQLVVYYFMTTYRCRSCTFIEGTTRNALDENYADEQKQGRIVFKMINIEEPQNKHFVDEYGIFTKSVVLSDLKNGKQEKWKNLDKVWNMIGDEAGFKSYIAKEVKDFSGS